MRKTKGDTIKTKEYNYWFPGSFYHRPTESLQWVAENVGKLQTEKQAQKQIIE